MRKKRGANVAAASDAPAQPSGTQTPADPNSKRSLRKLLAANGVSAPKGKAKASTKKKAKGTGNVAIGSALMAPGVLIKGGVLGMLATGTSSRCERPIDADFILSQLSAIPGCVEYTSLLDSFVENGTYANINDDREDNTSQCKIAGPLDAHNWKGGACLIDTSSPEPDICRNMGWNDPCCFVGLDLSVQGGN